MNRLIYRYIRSSFKFAVADDDKYMNHCMVDIQTNIRYRSFDFITLIADTFSISFSKSRRIIREFLYKEYGVTGEIRKIYLKYKSFQIKATWSPEMVQDIQAYHGINVEDELVRILTEEIDRAILNEIVNTNIDNSRYVCYPPIDNNYLHNYINGCITNSGISFTHNRPPIDD